MIGTIVGLIIIGLAAGAIARLVIPGKQDLSIAMTIVIGVAGSFVGGFLGYLIFGHDKSGGFVQPSSWIGSIIGAIIMLVVYLRVSGAKSVR